MKGKCSKKETHFTFFLPFSPQELVSLLRTAVIHDTDNREGVTEGALNRWGCCGERFSLPLS